MLLWCCQWDVQLLGAVRPVCVAARGHMWCHRMLQKLPPCAVRRKDSSCVTASGGLVTELGLSWSKSHQCTKVVSLWEEMHVLVLAAIQCTNS